MPSRHHIVMYDIADAKRLRRVARVMQDFGVRVQKSVFECMLDDTQLRRLQQKILGLIDVRCDSVRYIPLCANDLRRRIVQHPPGQAPPSAVPPTHWVL